MKKLICKNTKDRIIKTINQIKIKAIKNEFIYLIVEFPRMCRMYV